MKTRGADGRLVLIFAAVAVALVPMSAPAVERAYSAALFPAIQALLTSASNRVSVAILDVFIACVCVGIAVDAGRAFHRHAGSGWVRAAAVLWRVAAWPAALYLLFLLTWGLNYRRVPLAGKLRFDPAAVTNDAARDLATLAAAQLSMLYAPAHGAGWRSMDDVSPALATSFAMTVRQLGVARPVVLGRPKRTMLDWYFHRAGVDGMTDPFFLETLVATDLLPFERPLVVAHEWSHLAGFADEGEANFAGWLTCLRGAAGDRYSGWLFLFAELARDLPFADRAEVTRRLGPGPRDDLEAIGARLRRQVNPRVSAAGWRAYDSYLKANRVEEGVGSYGKVVRLALGVRFGDEWTPLLK